MRNNQPNIRSFRAALSSYQKALKATPARMGRPDGTLAVDAQINMIWATEIETGAAVEVLNQRVFPEEWGKFILIGYDRLHFPTRRQVLTVWDVYPEAGNLGVFPHSDQHREAGEDPTRLDPRQWLTSLAVPVAGTLTIQVYAATYRTLTGWKTYDSVETVDFSASVPASGARAALLVVDGSGAFALRDGPVVEFYYQVDDTALPEAETGDTILWVIVCYAGQVEAVETDTQRDLIDLRFSPVANARTLPATTAGNDFLIGDGSTWLKKTLAESVTILRTSLDGIYAGLTHASRHISTGDDPIPSAVAGGASGLMTGADKTKLDGIAAGATAGITALTGDVTATGPGSAAATIAAKAVTLAKLADLAANSLIGNNTGSPAAPVALTVAKVLALAGLATSVTAGKTLTLAATGDFTLTVPETMTAAGRNVAQTFTANQRIDGILSIYDAQFIRFAASNLQMRTNYVIATDRLSDTSKESYSLSLDNGNDEFILYRAPATAGAPSYAQILLASPLGLSVSGNVIAAADKSFGWSSLSSPVSPITRNATTGAITWNLQNYSQVHLGIISGNAATVPLYLQIAASQTANAFEVRSALGAVLASIGATGKLTIADSGAPVIISTRQGANSDGYNLWINSSGGAGSLGEVGATYKGSYNLAIGPLALNNLTKGAINVAIGYLSLYNNIIGLANLAIGSNALFNALGNANAAVGGGTLYNLINGSNNLGMGSDAGRYIADGVTANAAVDNSVYMGVNTKASASGNTNETVIGYGAIGNGSNTVTIGSASVTATYVRSPVIPSDNYYYIGEPTTDGSWRFGRSGNNLQVERRESASWISKAIFEP